MKRIFWLGIVMIALLEACNFGGESPETYYPPQTRIVRIDLTPDTVATKDTVLIHCVIEDSTDTQFKYSWGLGKDTLAVNGTVNGPYIKYIAPSLGSQPKGTVIIISGGINIDNGSVDSLEVGGVINIPVLVK